MKNRSEAIARLLLEHEADPSQEDKAKETPLNLLVKWKRPQLAATEGCLMVKESGSMVEKPLYSADYNAHESVGKLLVEHMVNKNPSSLERRDKENRTALHWAVIYRHEDVAIALIENGAELNAKDVRGSTPFSVCEQSVYPSKIRQNLMEAIHSKFIQTH